MKTTHTPESVAAFLRNIEDADPASVAKLTEGHASQAFSFETWHGDKYVLRISDNQDDFEADKYAADTFGAALLVPKVIEIGEFEPGSYYCVSALAAGKTSNILNQEELGAALPSIQRSLADMFRYDISTTSGYGHVDVQTGDAIYTTWKDATGNKIEMAGIDAFRANAVNIGLDKELIDAFFGQFRNNLQYASEVRRLTHGDPAFDNMLVENGEVTAVIDWAQMGYGDWMSDFARLSFWWPGRYGDARAFAEQYGLETEHLDKRFALYWATNALWTIEFADKTKSKGVSDWLKEYVKQKLM